MIKHTPGPWHVNVTASDDLEVNDARGGRVCVWYASVECRSPGDPDLVAAAPDMLALLREVFRRVDNGSPVDLQPIEDLLTKIDGEA